MLVFKGVPEGTIEKRLNKLPEVINHKIYIACQSNAWVDSSTFVKWLNRIWFKTYPYKPIKGSILYTIIPSSLLISVSKIAFAPRGSEVNNKLYKVIYQSSIIV